MIRTVKKEIKQEEYMIVIYNTLEALFMQYRYTMPNHIRKKTLRYLSDLYKEYSKNYIQGDDISECEIFERITFSNNKKKFKKKRL